MLTIQHTYQLIPYVKGVTIKRIDYKLPAKHMVNATKIKPIDMWYTITEYHLTF